MNIVKRNEVTMPIVNIEQLGRGTGARYLECIKSHCETLVAMQWRRTIPVKFDVLIDYQMDETQ